MWCDGSKFNYENWYDDDHDDEDERCLKMNYPSNYVVLHNVFLEHINKLKS